MAITSAIVMFAVTWFMVLFIVLPLRLTTQGEAGNVVPGTHSSSPEGLNIRRKLAVTTLVAVVVWAILCGIILSGVIGIRDIDVFNVLRPPGSADGRGG